VQISLMSISRFGRCRSPVSVMSITRIGAERRWSVVS
jgi:hypothetical protein